MQALKRIGRPGDIAGHLGRVILQDKKAADYVKCGDDQHAIHIKWRKVSNG
jgi:hypothetical protein